MKPYDEYELEVEAEQVRKRGRMSCRILGDENDETTLSSARIM
jgi:hypothetical protein